MHSWTPASIWFEMGGSRIRVKNSIPGERKSSFQDKFSVLNSNFWWPSFSRWHQKCNLSCQIYYSRPFNTFIFQQFTALEPVFIDNNISRPLRSSCDPSDPSSKSGGRDTPKGPSIKYVTLFLTNFYPLPCHTLSHISGPPYSTSHISDPPRFLVVQKARSKIPYTKSLSMVRGVFVLGFLSGRFCPG